MPDTYNTTILIVGGGLAGLFTALKLAPLPCTVLSPRPLGEGASSSWAQGGIAAAMSEGDTAEAHAIDTIAAGAGTVDEAVARMVANEAAERVHDLLSYGVPFDRDLAGKLVQSREAAHSAKRIVRVGGDGAGAAIMQALIATVRNTPSITVLEGYVAEDLLLADGACAGVLARGDYGRASKATRFHAAATVLATGGIGHLYAVTTNPAEARGEGLAMAARAGAVIADAEFVQFHPTALAVGLDPAPLATEAIRGEGGILVNRAGERFMLKLHADAELAPRDIVARGVFAEVASGRGAFLDARAAIGAEFPHLFPAVTAACRKAGIDPVTDLLPVAPAEHYHMGGIATDMQGRATLSGLYAAGEVASTGLHGANRLASNSLLEAVVFGARVAEELTSRMLVAPSRGAPVRMSGQGACLPTQADLQAIARLRAIMADKAGVIRDGAGLLAASRQLQAIADAAESSTLVNMASAALVIVASALARRESRGGHWRSDFPQTSIALATRSKLTLSPPELVGA
ncbi:L-aspartate oxidase [Bosea caraganae]|uniref:L-aspartate oxidase n=1 Tax=Bosea caraganae TaxID=2763117 RepID=A0A370KZL8_9HYPH|nr:L-aspartate oxidase [Bosea caraganae]RDJ20438.1 L-aspartate oxidase [Bosea caraganae]RDJ29953.1 L-aspartate oxidase [Bosea caraganae]